MGTYVYVCLCIVHAVQLCECYFVAIEAAFDLQEMFCAHVDAT